MSEERYSVNYLKAMEMYHAQALNDTLHGSLVAL